jgi:hypothetical protein
MATFPVLSKRQDSSKYGVEFEDPAKRSEMEGGYTFTRPMHTRAPRKTFKVGYTMLTATDKLALEAFWTTVRGGSLAFDWTNQQDNLIYNVRFKEKLSFTYAGAGDSQYWNCLLTLEQV